MISCDVQNVCEAIKRDKLAPDFFAISPVIQQRSQILWVEISDKHKCPTSFGIS